MLGISTGASSNSSRRRCGSIVYLLCYIPHHVMDIQCGRRISSVVYRNTCMHTYTDTYLEHTGMQFWKLLLHAYSLFQKQIHRIQILCFKHFRTIVQFLTQRYQPIVNAMSRIYTDNRNSLSLQIGRFNQ